MRAPGAPGAPGPARAAADLVRRLDALRTGLLARPPHCVVFAAVAGLLCGPWVPWLATGVAGGLAAAVVLAQVRAGRWTPASGASAVTLAVSLALVAGVAVGGLRTAALERSRLGPDLGHVVTARVTVQEAPRRSRFGGWSALVAWRGEPVLLRVAGATEPPGVGAILDAKGGLRPPGEFARIRRAHAELRAADVAMVGRRDGPLGSLDRIRERAEAALDRGLPPATAGLFRGMVLGQDDALPDATRDEFRAAGLSHLVAASGTNVVLLAALATGLGTALGLGLTARLWLVLSLIAVYVPLAGGGASIQRAGVMGAAAVAAGLVGRPASRWYALGLAALVTLTLDPRAAAEPGWQLSFVAVLALLVVAPGWRRRLERHGLPRGLAEVVAMTAAATVATAPLVAAHFGETSVVGLPANVLAAPAVAPVMWVGLVVAAVGQFAALGGVVTAAVGVAADGLGALAGFPLGYLRWIAATAAGAPGSVVRSGPWPVLLVAGAVLLVAGSGRVRRAAPAAVAVGAALWLAFAPSPAARAQRPAGLRVTFLDVGQGDATLVQDGDRAVLVDAGLADAGILGLLRRAGVERLDLLVATHASADHDGGAAAVVSSLPVGAILDGGDGRSTPGLDALAAAARVRGVRVVAARAGQVLRVGGLTLRVLWPRPEPAAVHSGEDPNGRAVVLELEARGARALLAADAESDVLGRLDLRPVEVMKVSHHGSADPGLPRVLDRLRPRIAGIEVGAGNTYGHPAPSTLAALAGVPVVVRTDRDGTVRLDRTADGTWEVRANS